METGGKQTNSCHLPRVVEEVPFTARNVTGSEVSQETACRGRGAGGPEAESRGKGLEPGVHCHPICREGQRAVLQGWESPQHEETAHLCTATHGPPKESSQCPVEASFVT